MYFSVGGLAVALVAMLLTFGACRHGGGGAAAGEPTPKRRRGRYERGRVDGELPVPVAARCVTMLVRRPGVDSRSRPLEEITLETDGLGSVAELRAAVQAALASLYGAQGTEGFRIVHEKRDSDTLALVGAGSSLKDVLRAKRLQVLLPVAQADPRGATTAAAAKPATAKPATAKPATAKSATAKSATAKPAMVKPTGGKRDRRRREGSSRSVETDVELGCG